MRVEITSVTVLRFEDGAPVRAASAVGAYRGGWLVCQDDSTLAAWWRPDGEVERVRVFPPVEGLDLFEEASGTKHLKPDVEAACAVPGGLLLLGSGSTAVRTRGALLPTDGGPPQVLELAAAYDAVAVALGLDRALLNLEGACLVAGSDEPVLRWFQRGSGAQPSGAVDLELEALLAGTAVVRGVARHLDLPAVDGVALSVTDAVALADGTVLVSAAAEDTANPVDDGPVVATALARVDDEDGLDLVRLPLVAGEVCKVEGLAVERDADGVLDLLAVVDADDPARPSQALRLRVELDARS